MFPPSFGEAEMDRKTCMKKIEERKMVKQMAIECSMIGTKPGMKSLCEWKIFENFLNKLDRF